MRKKWISPSRYVAILFILRLWEVRESDDFVTKYDIYNRVCVKEWDIWTNTARKDVCSFLYPSPWVYVWIAYKILIWNTWYMMHVLAWTFLSLYVLFFWEGYLPLLTCLYVSPLPVKHGGGGDIVFIAVCQWFCPHFVFHTFFFMVQQIDFKLFGLLHNDSLKINYEYFYL